MNDLIIVRGGGDLATGTIYKLKKCGFPVLILETANPSAIRRNVAFCEAVYQGSQTVEDLTCFLANSLEQAETFLREGRLTVLIDPLGESVSRLKPLAVVDAILAKKNLGTNRSMAPITIATEPVIPEHTDEIIVVCGLNTIGQQAGEVCHRLELVKKCLGIADDTRIRPEHVRTLATEGYLRPLREAYPDKRITLSPRHDGSPEQKAIAAMLQSE